jgi:hypothetical protein
MQRESLYAGMTTNERVFDAGVDRCTFTQQGTG